MIFITTSSFQSVIRFLTLPVCLFAAWAIVFLVGSYLWKLGWHSVKISQRLHKIPCAKCRFYTSSHHLKCTVNPTVALTEDAIDCQDYQPYRSLRN